MRRPLCQTAALCLALALLVTGCAEERRPTFEVRVLPNGLTIVAKENRGSGVVSVQAWVRDGALFETPEEAGASFLLSTMIFDQTPERGPGEIAKTIEGLGGFVSSMSRHDYSQHVAVVPSDHFGPALEVFVDGLLNPIFDTERVEMLKARALRQLTSAEERPIERAYRLCLSDMLRGHPYGRLPEGTPESVVTLSAEMLQERHREHYVPSNIVMVVAGNVDPVSAADRVEGLMSGLEGGTVAEPAAPPVQWPTETRRLIEHEDVNKAYQVVAFPSPSVQDRDNITMDVILMILQRGRSSRLNRILKEELGLVHSVGAGWYTQRHPSPMFVWMELPPENIEPAERAVVEILGGLADEPVGEQELAKAKTMLESDVLHGLETADGQAFYYGYWTSISGIDFAEHYLERLKQVTAGDIQRAADLYFKPGVHVAAAIVPEWVK